MNKVGLTHNDVNKIIKQGVDKATKVASVFRKDRKGNPLHTQMHISLILRGEKEGTLMHSMPDAWDGSKDISKGKAFTASAFSSNSNALTTRAIGSFSQPEGPLWQIGNSNKEGTIIEFPGGVPLYKKNILVGAVGRSGDAVVQD